MGAVLVSGLEYVDLEADVGCDLVNMLGQEARWSIFYGSILH